MANNIETKPKIFKKADLIIYGALAAIILSLFIFLYLWFLAVALLKTFTQM